MNWLQQKMALVYAGGDFAHCTTEAEAERAGDTLFLFLWRELADEGSHPMTIEEAQRRIGRAVNDLINLARDMA